VSAAKKKKKSLRKAKRKAAKKARKKPGKAKAAKEPQAEPAAVETVEKPEKQPKEAEAAKKPEKQLELEEKAKEPEKEPAAPAAAEKPREEPEEEKAAEEPQEKPGTESTQPKEAPPMRFGTKRERGERKTITSAPVVAQEPGAVIRVERLEMPASTVIMTMGGFLQRSEANQIMKTVESLLKENITHILFDMSHVQYANSSAIGAFVNGASRLKADGGEAVLVAMRPNIRRIFETLGLIGLFIVAGSKEKAIEAIS
jgi:anti-anti-sigma factor